MVAKPGVAGPKVSPYLVVEASKMVSIQSSRNHWIISRLIAVVALNWVVVKV